MKRLDEAGEVRFGKTDEIESAVANYETAYRMQTAVPELMDVKGESAATRKLYGLDAKYPQTQDFRPAVSDRPAAGGARRPLHRIDVPVCRRARTAGTSTAIFAKATRTTRGPSISRSPDCLRT